MVVEFDNLSDDSRLWIYQIDRNLNAAEEKNLLDECIGFLSEWTAHGSKLAASAKIIDHRLLVIGADESFAGASGCSIDSQVAFLRDVQLRLGIDLFSRANIYYLENGTLQSMEINEFKSKIATGGLSEETVFYNTTIHTKGQLKDSFIIPVKESWLMRMISV